MRSPSLFVLLLLTGCAGTSAERVGAPEEARADAGSNLPLDELPPQTLVRGQCALVLWSRTSPVRRLFMGLAEPPSARVRVGGRTVSMPQTSASGEAAYGHHPVQTFAGEGLTLTVSAEFAARDGLVGGAAVPSAALTIRLPDGTETVIPTTGLLACSG